MAGLPLSQAIEEYLAWLELDRHASLGTVAGYRGDLRRFSDFAGGDVGIPDIAELDRDILRGYQRTSRGCAPARKAPGGRWPSRPDPAAWWLCAASCASPPAKRGYPATSGPPSTYPSCPNDSPSPWKPVTGTNSWKHCPTTRCPKCATER
jgi:Phage integrase, N-terminal SAM-like domain